jgi:hypothetical protein
MIEGIAYALKMRAGEMDGKSLSFEAPSPSFSDRQPAQRPGTAGAEQRARWPAHNLVTRNGGRG